MFEPWLASAPRPDERERNAVDDYDDKRDQFEAESDVIIRHCRTVIGAREGCVTGPPRKVSNLRQPGPSNSRENAVYAQPEARPGEQ